jgi:hypothetical protein
MLVQNIDKLNFDYVCQNSNPKILSILQNHLHSINWKILSSNESIFMYDKQQTRNNIVHYTQQYLLT